MSDNSSGLIKSMMIIGIGLRVILIKIGPEGRIAIRLTRIYAAIGWPIRSI